MKERLKDVLSVNICLSSMDDMIEVTDLYVQGLCWRN